MSYCEGYSGLAIADYFIEKALEDKKAITNIHVLKMIYFAQAFSFSELGIKLIKDDFYAWRFGPVEVKTYETFKHYGASPITSTSKSTKEELEDIKNKSEIVAFLDKLSVLAGVSAYKLVELTHVTGGPWDTTIPYDIIPTEKIRAYYGG